MAKSRPNEEWRIANLWHRAVSIVSGEWMLQGKSRRPNGGSIVAGRAVLTTLLLYAVALAVHEVVDPTDLWRFSWLALRELLIETGHWTAALFAASYAAYYARFSSQWAYLADVYNQIKAAEVRMWGDSAPNPKAKEALSTWKAGFIEDADDLHLATKPLFASVIVAWSAQEGVAEAFKEHAVDGKRRFDDIIAAAKVYCEKHRKELPVIEVTSTSTVQAQIVAKGPSHGG